MEVTLILLLILMVVVSQISVIIYEPNTFSFNVITTDVVVMVVMMVQPVVKIQGSSTPPGNVSNLTYCNSERGSSSYSNIDEVKLLEIIIILIIILLVYVINMRTTQHYV